MYYSYIGKAIYKKNRLKSSCKFKLLKYSDFIEYAVDKVKIMTGL